MSPYRIVFGKACHLLNIELTGQSSNAIWPMTKQAKKGSFSCKNWRSSTWKHTRIPRSTSKSQKVLLFNSRLKLIVGKLHSRWDGPFVINNVFPYGVVELKDEATNNTFQFNGYQLKIFHEGPTPIGGEMENISLMEPAMPNETP
ncbi:hypothetical protein CR513_35030, partial [Mucuna pruriens]